MAHAMASMAGLRGSSHAVLEGSLQFTGSSSRLTPAPVARRGAPSGGRGAGVVFVVKAQQQNHAADSEAIGRRTVMGLVAAGISGGALIKSAVAEVKGIKVGPKPPPSGGLPGTLNSDQPRDLDLPLKERFYLQPLPPAEAAARAKESAKDIVNLKELINKKAWPYVQMDLRLKASYLRYDLNTVIAAKPSKAEKKSLKELTGQLFATIDGLDHAAKIKSTPEAEKYYAATTTVLNDVLSKLG